MWTPSRASGAAARSVSLSAALLALAAVLGLVEATLVPPLPVPGVRLGLANIAVVLALAALGPGRAGAIGLARVVIVGLATGGLGGPGFLMASAGCVAAWAAMSTLCLAGERFSAVGWSVAGAAAHVCAQLAVACALAGGPAPLALLPLSLAASLFTGLATGVCARSLLSRIPLTSPSAAVGA